MSIILTFFTSSKLLWIPIRVALFEISFLFDNYYVYRFLKSENVHHFREGGMQGNGIISFIVTNLVLGSIVYRRGRYEQQLCSRFHTLLSDLVHF